MKKENVKARNSQDILNSIQDLQRLLLQLVNNMRRRFQIKFAMTPIFNNDAFTLIEMLVVVLIIGVLAAIALPQYQKAVKRSTYAGMLPVLATVVEAQKLYYMTHGEYAQDMTKLDIELPITGTCEGTYEISADVGYAMEEYCLYLTNKTTNHIGILIGLASNKFNLPADGWKISGYEYLFSSTLGKRPAQNTYCRERSFWDSSSPRLRKDFHCTGELANYNNYGAWFKMD